MKSRQRVETEHAFNDWAWERLGIYARLGFWSYIKYCFIESLPFLGIVLLSITLVELILLILLIVCNIRLPKILVFPFYAVGIPLVGLWFDIRKIKKNRRGSKPSS